jgi:cell division protein FtsQ
MPRVAPPPKPARKPPPRRAAVSQTLGEPRSVKDRPRGWKLALRRQRRRIRPTLYGLGAVGLLVAIGAVVHSSSHQASLTSLRQRFGAAGALFGLRVENVVITGRATTPQPLLDAAIGVEKGQPLLGFSVSEARARIDSIASVQEATVERRWPSTVVVSLTERHATAVWQHDGRFALIDKSGGVLADQDVRLASQLPLVVGAGAPDHAATLLDDLAAHPDIRAHLVAAIRVSDRRWNLLMTSGAHVLLPDGGQAAALSRLDVLQKTHRLLDRPLQVIDLRLPDRVTLRPVTQAAAPGAPAPVRRAT